MRNTAIVVMLLHVCGCSGADETESGLPQVPGDVSSGPNLENSPGGLGGAANAQAPLVGGKSTSPFEGRMQRLTETQYQRTVAQIFGDFVTVPPLEPDLRSGGFEQLGASQVGTSIRGVELYEAAAHAVAEQVFAKPTREGDIGCTPLSPEAPDGLCAGMFLDRVGRQLFRRPLKLEERGVYLGIATAGTLATNDFWAGLEWMLAALLQSPLFLYRAEWWSGESGALLPVTGYEMASRLSFALLDSGPDAASLEAAERGDLDTPEGIVHHAQLLLGSERGGQNVEDFFVRMLRLPSGAAPEAIAKKRETLSVLQDLRDQGRPFTELYTAPFTYVNDTLAELYGLSERPGPDLTKVMLPEGSHRRGLLGHAAILAESGVPHSAILRGKFIREVLLCQVIPAPPPNVVPVLPELDANKPVTTRERLRQHRESPACASCHALMDPLGLALEHFDGTGKFRSDDNGLPIDPSGELDGVPFADAAELGQLLANHPDATRCLVATLHRRLTGQYEQPAQSGTIDVLRLDYVHQSQSIEELVMSIIAGSTFLQVTGPTQ